MELTLYDRYARSILTENQIDPFRERKIQQLIEIYSRDLAWTTPSSTASRATSQSTAA